MILRRLPRFMLFVVRRTSRRLSKVRGAVDPSLTLESTEGLEYLEFLARDSPAKWVCSSCYTVHIMSPSYGPCRPQKTNCPKDRAHLKHLKRKLCPIGPRYDHRFAQFVLKYRRLCQEPEWSTRDWCSLFHLIMEPIEISFRHEHWSFKEWNPWQWIRPRIEGDSVYIDQTLLFRLPDGFGLVQGAPYGEKWICEHQPFCAPGWWHGFSQSQRMWFPTITMRRDERHVHHGPPFSDPPAYQYHPVGDGNDWATVVQAATREPGKFFEGSCYVCPTRFGVMVRATDVKLWRREYIGSESVVATDAFKKSHPNRVQNPDTSSEALTLH
ncbi:hypothetical protein V2G26_007666 [Clonostachys chloroleuca]